LLDVKTEVLNALDTVLNLKGRAASLDLASPLLGAIPELDSMAVVALIANLEDRLGLTFEDDEIDGLTFASVGSLVEFLERKLDR